jgi:hypothetical protein
MEDHSKEQILWALWEAEAGETVVDVSRKVVSVPRLGGLSVCSGNSR